MSTAIYPSLAGKRVLVTGGGSGIGAAFVEEFVRQEADVWFVDILETESEALVERLSGARGLAPRFLHCDLTDLQAVQTAIQRIVAESGPINVLVNNAANDDRHSVESITPEYWDQRIAVNLRHLMFCSLAVLPGMKVAGGGAIINLGSISWHLALPTWRRTRLRRGASKG
jgi:NAD(P)-dependent dehydrogenase (short-subunit alcohol dehydrogenase family)